ncbi:MAG: hypothetical protein J2P49_03485, partial [Methylocapsa sp.]|nr:hypothetical protein [Methylocapsa sp.]
RAAELTLKAGYTHFQFEQANVSQGNEVIGATSIGNASVYGSNIFANSSRTKERRHIENVAVTVIMFHANEPGVQNAFDAAKVLQQQQG